MQYDIVLKKLFFTNLTPRVRGGLWGKNICYHVASFCDSKKCGLHHDNVLKMLNFDLLTPSPRVLEEIEGSAGKTFATMLQHFVIPINLICNMSMF